MFCGKFSNQVDAFRCRFLPVVQIVSLLKEWIRTDSLFRVKIFGWIRSDSLWSIYEFIWVSDLIVTVLGVDVFCKHSVWISTNAFSGVSPRPPTKALCDDSDADDAVLRISLYHIPDSASLASSASFRFCIFRSIIVFVWIGSKPSASFYYKRDGLSCIPLPISHKHRHYRHHRHLKQASRFNLRLACFIFNENFYGRQVRFWSFPMAM